MRVEWVLVAAIAASACGSVPKPVEPPRLKAALEVESDGARRYQRGDFVLAERRFEEAARRFAGIDDEAGGLRNRLHLARTRLALGRADAALELLGSLPADSPRDIEALLLKGQALLALGRVAEAGQALAAAEPRCGKDCGQLPSLKILLARTALADGRATAARLHADAALELLANDEHGQEIANAWRVLAAARLADLDPPGALAAAKAALAIDRRLALPEKIARDWLLIGDAHRGSLRDKAFGAAVEASRAYQRGLDIANAEGLSEISLTASLALKAIGMQKIPAE